MIHWPKLIFRTDEQGKLHYIRLEPSIEDFSAELQRHGETVIVAKGSCRECIYTPDRTAQLKTSDLQKLEQMTQEEMAIPECGCCTVARFRGKRSVPDFVICYGFFYTHWWKNPLLTALKEANLLSFLDVHDFSTLDEEGLQLYRTSNGVWSNNKER